MVHDLSDQFDQLTSAIGLVKEGVRDIRLRPALVGMIVKTAAEDHSQRRVEFSKTPCGFETVNSRHGEVDDGDVKFLIALDLQGVFPAGGFFDTKSPAAQDPGANGADRGLVVDDEDSIASRGFGGRSLHDA